MPDKNSPIIELKEVTFSHRMTPLLDNVSFAIDRGEYLGVIGPNGSGKTTLLKLMLGLIAPYSGEVLIDGKPPGENRRQIGYVPQLVSLDLSFPINVREVINTGLTHARSFFPWMKASLKGKVDAVMELVGLQHLSSRLFGALSGGEQKRCLIARALITEPSVLLLDEPTAGLDPKSEKEILELLSRLNQKLTIVQVSHDINFVSSHIQRVLCVSEHVDVHETKALTPDFLNALYLNNKRLVVHHHHPQ